MLAYFLLISEKRRIISDLENFSIESETFYKLANSESSMTADIIYIFKKECR